MKGRGKKLIFPFIYALLFLLGFESGGFQLVLVNIAAEFGLNNTVMGSLVTVQFLAILIMPLIFGRISDKIGKKKVLAISLPVFAAGCAITLFAGSVGAFAAGIFIVGFGYSVSECIGSAALSDNDPQKAEKNLTLSQVAFSAGAVTGPIIVNALMAGGIDWRVVFAVAGVGFVLLLPVLFIAKFSEKPVHELEKEHGGGAKLFKGGLFVALMISIFLYVGMENGFAFFVDSFFNSQLNNAELGAFAISAFWLGMTVSRLVFGILKANPTRVLTIMFGASAALLLGLALCSNAYLAVVLSAAAGMTYGPVWPMLVGAATGNFPVQSGLAASLMMAAGGLGGSFSPILLGFLADEFNFRISMGALVFFSVLAMFFCIVVIGKKSRGALPDTK